jgi:hypothetical protein
MREEAANLSLTYARVFTNLRGVLCRRHRAERSMIDEYPCFRSLQLLRKA